MTALAGFGVDQEATGPPSSAGRRRRAGHSVAPRRRVLAPRRREAGGVVGHDGPLVMPGPGSVQHAGDERRLEAVALYVTTANGEGQDRILRVTPSPGPSAQSSPSACAADALVPAGAA